MTTAVATPPAQDTPTPPVPPVTPPPAAPVETPPPAPPAEPAPPAPPPAAVVPETYSLTLPEGGHVDAADITAVSTLAKSMSWTNEQAQAALDDHAAALQARSVTFLAETKADPTYGGEHLSRTEQLAKAVLEKVRPAGTPRGDAFRRLLDKSGYGNHLEVISFLADLGSQMAEDSPGHSGAPSGAPKSTAAVLFGTPDV